MPFRVKSEKIQPPYLLIFATQPSKTSHAAESRHIKVQGQRSVFDADWIYWSTRMGRHPQVNQRVARLLKRQQGKCAVCHLFFKDKDLLEIDHFIPRAQGGKDECNNLQLLHRHCHDVKSANDNR